MKKRILALFLAGAMTLSLAACSGGSGNSTPAPADTTAPADTSAPADTTEPAKTVKVGLICIGDENDQGYTYNFVRGKEAATEALAAKGIEVEWVVKWNIGEDSGCEDANIELAEEGCDLIIMGSRGQGGVKGFLGSVSYAVVQGSPIAVLIAKDAPAAATKAGATD